MAKIFITGANGFVGSHILEKLNSLGHHIKCLVHRNSNFLEKLKSKRIEILKGSITEPEELKGKLDGVDYVFHCAGLLRTNCKEKYYQVNHEGTRNLLIESARSNIKHFVYMSSIAAVGPSIDGVCKTKDSLPEPVSDYGRSKLFGEMETIKFNRFFPVTILRPSAIYGPRDRDLLPFFKFAEFGIFPVITGDPSCLIQPVFIGDLVEICAGIIEKNKSKMIYYICEEKPYTWKEIHEIFERIKGKKILMVNIPDKITKLLAWMMESVMKIAGKTATLNRDKVKELCKRCWLANVSDTVKDFNIKFTDFENGAKITYKWYKENKWI